MYQSSFEGGEIPAFAAEQLQRVFPGAVFNKANIPHEDQGLENLRRAGLDIVEVLESDGSCSLATYAFADTPQTRIISILFDYEEKGLLREGTQDEAIDDVIRGTFDEKWERFYSRLQD